jgi:hypothetical protein
MRIYVTPLTGLDQVEKVRAFAALIVHGPSDDIW